MKTIKTFICSIALFAMFAGTAAQAKTEIQWWHAFGGRLGELLDTQVNKDNIRNGFFELDWNNQFIEELLDAGYSGESNEQIVDAWFTGLCRQIAEDVSE